MDEIEKEYKQAVIKLQKQVPSLIKTLREHTRAMYKLSRAINNMPRTVRMR